MVFRRVPRDGLRPNVSLIRSCATIAIPIRRRRWLTGLGLPLVHREAPGGPPLSACNASRVPTDRQPCRYQQHAPSDFEDGKNVISCCPKYKLLSASRVLRRLAKIAES